MMNLAEKYQVMMTISYVLRKTTMIQNGGLMILIFVKTQLTKTKLHIILMIDLIEGTGEGAVAVMTTKVFRNMNMVIKDEATIITIGIVVLEAVVEVGIVKGIIIDGITNIERNIIKKVEESIILTRLVMILMMKVIASTKKPQANIHHYEIMWMKIRLKTDQVREIRSRHRKSTTANKKKERKRQYEKDDDPYYRNKKRKKSRRRERDKKTDNRESP